MWSPTPKPQETGIIVVAADIGRNMDRWHCGGKHLERNCPKRAEEKEKQKDDGSANNKGAEVKGGQLHTMFTSSVDVQPGMDFSELGEDD